MKKLMCCLLALSFAGVASAQKNIDNLITADYVDQLIKTLSSDEMQGRATFTPGIDKAATFIEGEFKKIGLEPLTGATGFRQTFNVKKSDQPLFNVVGMIPGKSKAKEIVVFSGHYDHLGIVKSRDQDSIANGADDDASGTTAVIALAKYYKALNNNERTLIFVAFTAEEIGGFGAKHFSSLLNPDEVVAMFNIEMIGKESKFGKILLSLPVLINPTSVRSFRKIWKVVSLPSIRILTQDKICSTEVTMQLWLP